MTDPLVAIYRVDAGGGAPTFVGYGSLVDFDFVLAHSTAARLLQPDLPSARVRCWLDPAGADARVLDGTAVPAVTTRSGPIVGITLDGNWGGDFSNVPLTIHDPVEEVAAESARRIALDEQDDPDGPPPGSPGEPQRGSDPVEPGDRPWWCKLCPSSARCR